MIGSRTSIPIDKLGICASALCLAHCLSIPFFTIVGLSSVSVWINVEWIEITTLGTVFILGLVAFLPGFLRHRQHFVPVLFVAGLLLIVNGEAVSELWLGLLLSTLGAAIIIYAHYQNYRLRSCPSP